MIKRLVAFLWLAIAASLTFAQTTAVTATVVDSDAIAWANGTWQVQFVPNPAQPNVGIYNVNGVLLTPAQIMQSGSMSSTGALSDTVLTSSAITPTGSSWTIQVCPNASSKCGSIPFTTSGGSLDLSSLLTAAIPAPRFNGVSGAYGYADIEAKINLAQGSTYFNVLLQQQRFYNTLLGTWYSDAGGGTPGVNNGVPNAMACAGPVPPVWCTPLPGTIRTWILNATAQVPLSMLSSGTASARVGEVQIGTPTVPYTSIGNIPTPSDPAGSPIAITHYTLNDCYYGSYFVKGPVGMSIGDLVSTSPSDQIKSRIKNCILYSHYVQPIANIISVQENPAASPPTAVYTVDDASMFTTNTVVIPEGAIAGGVRGLSVNHNRGQVLSVVGNQVTVLQQGMTQASWSASATTPMTVYAPSAGVANYCGPVFGQIDATWIGVTFTVVGFPTGANNGSFAMATDKPTPGCLALSNASASGETTSSSAAKISATPPLITETLEYDASVSAPIVITGPDSNGNMTYTGMNPSDCYPGWVGRPVVFAAFANGANNNTFDMTGCQAGPTTGWITVKNSTGVPETSTVATTTVKAAQLWGESTATFVGGDFLNVNGDPANLAQLSMIDTMNTFAWTDTLTATPAAPITISNASAGVATYCIPSFIGTVFADVNAAWKNHTITISGASNSINSGQFKITATPSAGCFSLNNAAAVAETDIATTKFSFTYRFNVSYTMGSQIWDLNVINSKFNGNFWFGPWNPTTGGNVNQGEVSSLINTTIASNRIACVGQDAGFEWKFIDVACDYNEVLNNGITTGIQGVYGAWADTVWTDSHLEATREPLAVSITNGYISSISLKGSRMSAPIANLTDQAIFVTHGSGYHIAITDTEWAATGTHIVNNIVDNSVGHGTDFQTRNWFVRGTKPNYPLSERTNVTGTGYNRTIDSSTIQLLQQQANNDTIVLDGVTLTAVTGAPGAYQYQIGATVLITMTNLNTFLAASADPAFSANTYSISAGGRITLTPKTPGYSQSFVATTPNIWSYADQVQLSPTDYGPVHTQSDSPGVQVNMLTTGAAIQGWNQPALIANQIPFVWVGQGLDCDNAAELRFDFVASANVGNNAQIFLPCETLANAQFFPAAAAVQNQFNGTSSVDNLVDNGLSASQACVGTNGSKKLINGTCSPVATVLSPGGALVCAVAADTTIDAQTVTVGSSTSTTMTYTMAAVPNVFYPGVLLQAQGNTPSGYNGGPFTVVSTTATTVTVSSNNNPAALTIGGTLSFYCINQVTDALTSSATSTGNTYTVPANFFAASGATLTLQDSLHVFTAAVAENVSMSLRKNATVIYNSSAATAPTAGLPGGRKMSMNFRLTSIGANLVSTDLTSVSFPGSSNMGIWANTILSPNTVSASAEALGVFAGYTATGVVSATYVSGGTFAGTGVCTLGAFNNSSTATGTIVVTAATPSTITITARGASATAAPTSVAQINSCTGTATWTAGAITITSVLGGSPGNAILQLDQVVQ